MIEVFKFKLGCVCSGEVGSVCMFECGLSVFLVFVELCEVMLM